MFISKVQILSHTSPFQTCTIRQKPFEKHTDYYNSAHFYLISSYDDVFVSHRVKLTWNMNHNITVWHGCCWMRGRELSFILCRLQTEAEVPWCVVGCVPVMMADTSALYESVVCVKSEVHVYRIPPRSSNRGYRWDSDSFTSLITS